MTFHAYRFFKHGSRSMPGAQGLAMMAGGRAPAAAGNYQARNDEEEGAQQYNRPAPRVGAACARRIGSRHRLIE